MSYQQLPLMSEGTYIKHASSGKCSHSIQQACAHRKVAGQTQAAQADNSMASLTSAFSQTHLGVPNSNIPTNTSAVSVSGPQFFYTADGQLVYIPGPGMFSTPPMGHGQLQDGNYGGYPSMPTYTHQATYPGYVSSYPMLPYTPARAGYYSERSVSDIMHKEVPGLENRRGSYSTNESAPGTPFYSSLSHRGQGTHIAAIDRSPIYSTPSPEQLPHVVTQTMVKAMPYKNVTGAFDVNALLQQQPNIPQAVPAVFTPRENMRTLEQSLSNPIHGNRNVYIRGLHPNTDDETLAAYTARFGRVETSKAIIDTSTGACKGFGFAKYFDVRDSEMCIRGFYKLGYEVGFARESFNSRLKANGDDNSTNLYVSNLPKNMTESELGAIFMDYTVSSSRILRDTQGQSRGVGFARFEGRDVCEEIIKKFHGQPIGEEGLLLQVRYADTPAQKDLKRVTTERRQFRTTEYNVGAYGASAPEIIGLSPTLPSPVIPRLTQIGRHIPGARTGGSWNREVSGATSNTSSSGGGSFTVGDIVFKDININTVKVKSDHMTEATTTKDSELSTPTVSEDGSGDEGATIQCVSPVSAKTTSTPSGKKT